MRRWRRCARGLVLGLALGTLHAAGAAGDAIPYFNGPGRIGFDNADLGLPPELRVAGQQSLPGLRIKQKIKNIKFRDGAFSVRIGLRVKNRTGVGLDDLLLLVSALTQPSSVAPDTPIELDLEGDKLSPLAITRLPAGLGPERFFAGLEIGSLPNKKKFRARLEYRVLGALETGRASTFGLTIGTQPTVVPEPGTALLLGGGLLALAARRRN